MASRLAHTHACALNVHSFQRGLKRKSLTLIKKLRKAVRVGHVQPSRAGRLPRAPRQTADARRRALAPLQKKEAASGEKPEPVRTHLRDMVIVPEMIGSVIGVYNGKTFNQVEIKARARALVCVRAAVLHADAESPRSSHNSPRWSAPTRASTPSPTSP
jgi:ribosomal protein S19